MATLDDVLPFLSNILHMFVQPPSLPNTLHIFVQLLDLSIAPSIPSNMHTMITHSKASLFKPKVLESTLISSVILPKPRNYKEGLKVLE